MNDNCDFLMRCRKCSRVTNHVKLREHSDRIEEQIENYRFVEDNDYQIVKCRGCNTISFRQVTQGTDIINPESGDWDSVVTVYPPNSGAERSTIETSNLPRKIRLLYTETLDAFNSDLLILCAAGVRAIVEAICVDKGVTRGTVLKQTKDGPQKKVTKDLEGKIQGLAENGLLTTQHAAILHEHRFMGNDAIHQVKSISREALSKAIDIIEHTLENIYDLEQVRQDLLRAKSKGK